MNALMLLAALALLLIAQAELLRRFALKRLGYARSFSQRAAFAGEEVRMVEIIQNRKILPIPFLKAESRISPNLSFLRAVDTHIAWGQYHKSVFFLRPYSRLTRSHTVLLKERGFYQAGSVTLTAMDLVGLSGVTQPVETGACIEVYPRILPAAEIPLSVSRWQGDLIVRRWIAPDPIWVSGVRDYAPGDEPSLIHWPATARAGSLQVKVRDTTAEVKMLIVINAQMSQNQWADLMPYEQQTVENMISLTATLVADALRNGMDAGFAANIPMDKRDGFTILPPARHAAREGEMLSAMAHLTIERTRSFLSLLDVLGGFTGMDMLLLSTYDSDQIQERIETLRLRGNSVKLHLVPLTSTRREGGDNLDA